MLVPLGVDRLEATVRWRDYLFVQEGGAGSAKKGPAVAVPGSGGLFLEVTAPTLRVCDTAGLLAGTRSVSVFLVNGRPPMVEEKEDEAKGPP